MVWPRAAAQWVLPTGCNFVHQSTTGMGHDLANGYSAQRTRAFEMLYYSDCLVTAPAHASYTDWAADYTQDLYMGHVPTFFNSPSAPCGVPFFDGWSVLSASRAFIFSRISSAG